MPLRPAQCLGLAPASVGPPASSGQQAGPGRRRLALAAFVVVPLGTLSQAASAGAQAPTPYERGLNQQQYGLQNGRIRACEGDVNPNCLSTSSKNDAYYPAVACPFEPAEGAKAFGAALQEVTGSRAQLVDSQSEPGREYRRWAVPGSFGQDFVEVLFRRSDVETEDTIATFRSMAGAVKYLWPISQAISDMGAQRKRANLVRQRLGWRIMGGGCGEIECFVGV